MRTFAFVAFVVSIFVALAVTIGCKQSEQPTGGQSTAPMPRHEASEPQPQSQVSESSDTEQYAEVLAQLPEEDRKLAEAQKVCPVSGQPLGSMGKPVKVEIEGKTVFLCCPGCEGELRANPEKYLAKLGQE